MIKRCTHNNQTREKKKERTLKCISLFVIVFVSLLVGACNCTFY